MERVRVVVVGGAGFIGRAVAELLRAGGREVVVVDRRPGAAAAPDRDVAPLVDIATPAAVEQLTPLFRGAAAVVHLAARVDPPAPGERDAMRRLHVDGTRNVVRAARAAGVPRFVLASSAVVYGARPENRVPLDESTPVRPNADFPYAVDKAAQEDVLAAEGGGLARAVARPAIVYGRGARNYLTEIIRSSPLLPALDGRRPQLQFVHVDDVARALAFLATASVEGAFNVASADWLALEDVAQIAGKRVLDVPVRFVAPVLDALARVLPPHLRAPASMLPYLMHPFVLSSTKLAAAGCAPRLTSAEALRSILG